MRLRHLALLAPALALGCVESSTTDPALEQRVFNLLGGLEVGEALTARGAGAQEIFLTGGQEGSAYVYIPFWATSEEGDQVLNVEVTGTNLNASGSSRSLAPLPDAASLGRATPRPLDHAFHDRLRLRERELQRLIPAARAAQLRRSEAASALAVPNVGDVMTLNANAFQACSQPVLRNARVEAVTARSIVVVDVANPPSNFTRADYQSIGLTFDTLIYRVNARVFGEPADIDANGRTIIFYTRVVNELTPPNSRGYVGGFFYFRDLLPRSATAGLPGCPSSNQAEVFYMLAPDPTGVVNGNRFSERLVRENTLSTTGHEFQHLINASRRIYVNNANGLEEPWLDEGLSHIAEEIIFYDASGLQPKQNIGIERIRSSQRIVDAFVTYMWQNIGRYWSYLENPSAESLMGVDAELETRGAIWSFLRFAADHKGINEPLFRQLTNSRTSGLANLRQVLGEDPIDLMQNWTVSVYADDAVGGIQPRFTQPSWNFRSIYGFLNDDVFPLKVLTLSSSARTTVALKGGGSAFLEIKPQGGQNAGIQIKANAKAAPDSLRISVLRVR